MRAISTALCRLLLRIFFRRIESVGSEQVPSEAPTLYVLNHPNALLDPLFILCLSPRPVSFLAKAPLFSTFLVKHFVRAFECLPVYREQDGEDPSKNRASIEASIALLAGGKALALFPEGTSHSDPKLRPLKTGAARIALSSSARSGGRAPAPVSIVPVGLHFTDKTTFRSNALLVYGPPIQTPQLELDADARPPRDAVDRLTAEIDAALCRVTLQAQTHEALELARAAARIIAAADRDEGQPASEGLVGLELERRLVDGYERLREQMPGELAEVVARVRSYEAELARFGLPLDHPAKLDRRAAIRYGVRRLAALALLLGPALIGLVTHFPAYRAIDWLAHRVARQSTDVLATLKLIAGFLLFPLSWALLAVVVGVLLGWPEAALALIVLPLCGYAALRFFELAFDLVDRARGAWVIATRQDVGQFLLDERRTIRAMISEIGEIGELATGR